MSDPQLNFTAIMATLAAILSGICAFLSYKLSVKLRNELKSDEIIIAGTPIHPNLLNSEHRNCVLVCMLFNKSKRKTFVNNVIVFDDNNKKIDASWSNSIDSVGNTILPCKLIGIVDSEYLYIRHYNSEWFYSGSIAIYHSFSDEPLIVKYKNI